MADYPNTNSLFDSVNVAGAKTRTGLSTQIVIYVNNEPVGAIQSFAETQSRSNKPITEVGTDGVIELVPQGPAKFSLTVGRIVFDGLSLPESFSRGFKNIHSQRIPFDIVVIDHDSKKEDLEQIKKQLEKSNFKNSIISLDINEFINNIKKVNAKNENVTENQMSNMSNIHKSLLVGKNQSNDLIYFVEDDYLHKQDAINEMIFTYERISSQINRELILCPADYPYLYTKIDPTNIFLGANKHWRKIDETLCTFLTSKIILEKYWEKFISMCQFEHYPFEQPLHDIYKIEYCLSPIPSLALHCTNVNSIFGLSPNLDWKKIWNENGDY